MTQWTDQHDDHGTDLSPAACGDRLDAAAYSVWGYPTCPECGKPSSVDEKAYPYAGDVWHKPCIKKAQGYGNEPGGGA